MMMIMVAVGDDVDDEEGERQRGAGIGRWSLSRPSQILPGHYYYS